MLRFPTEVHTLNYFYSKLKKGLSSIFWWKIHIHFYFFPTFTKSGKKWHCEGILNKFWTRRRYSNRRSWLGRTKLTNLISCSSSCLENRKALKDFNCACHQIQFLRIAPFSLNDVTNQENVQFSIFLFLHTNNQSHYI